MWGSEDGKRYVNKILRGGRNRYYYLKTIKKKKYELLFGVGST